MNNIELLAPVGDQNALKAAVNNGADAVYLGAKTFSARESASNFADAELLGAIEYCHLRSVRVYVAVNTLLRDREIEEAIELIKPLYYAGVDSIILQDFGAASIIANAFPGLPLHASTQLGVHNVSGAEWAEQFGFKRAILSREVTIDSINKIRKSTNIELEAFAHGALCSSFSGQCLFSSFIGGRSGNRGRCAQPCRLFYELYDNGNKCDGGYLLSTKEMCTIGILKDMMNAGVSSFKIEGRARRGEYVSLAVRSYRTAIDAILEGKAINETETLDDLMKMYNRGGFGTGYYMGNRDIVAPERSNNWGVFIGTVEKVATKKIYIKSKFELNVGDGIEYIGDKPKGSYGLSSVIKVNTDLYAVDTMPNVVVGDKVYRNTDVKLINREKALIENESHFNLMAEFNAMIGKNATLSVYDDMGNTASAVSSRANEKSMKPFDMTAEAQRSIAKTGGTSFIFTNIDVNSQEEAWLPISEIAQMRRECLETITQKRLSSMRLYEPKPQEITLTNDMNEIINDKKIIVQTGNLNNATVAIESGASAIYYDPENFDEISLTKIKDFDKNGEIYIKMPIFMQTEDEDRAKELLRKYSALFNGVVISHITQLELAKIYFKKVVGGSELNVFNSSSYRYLYENDVKECVLSPELNIAQAKAIRGANKNIIVQGKLTLMNLPHCPVYNTRKCNCNGLIGVYLKDRKGYMLPLKRSKVVNCNVKVLNSVELCALPIMDEINKTDINGYVIVDEGYNKVELIKLIHAYKKAQTSELSKTEIDVLSKGTTRGHLNKGVL